LVEYFFISHFFCFVLKRRTIGLLKAQLKKFGGNELENLGDFSDDEPEKENNLEEKKTPDQPDLTVDELKIRLQKETEKKEMILKEFKRKSFEILRAFRSLIGFKVKYSDKIVKLVCEKTPNNHLSFRVIFLSIFLELKS